MEKYLIESPHTDDDCRMVVESILAAGYLTHFQWGCDAGEHCGWAMIDADNEAEALLVVPAILRKNTRVVRLNTYTPEYIHAQHGKG